MLKMNNKSPNLKMPKILLKLMLIDKMLALWDNKFKDLFNHLNGTHNNLCNNLINLTLVNLKFINNLSNQVYNNHLDYNNP